jgi:prephenate dehydrogenase
MDEDGFTPDQAQVCVVGLGLMGGSLALALGGQVAAITGIDVDSATRETAVAQGVVGRAGGDLSLAAEADIVVLATPVRAIVRLVGELGGRLKPGALLIDLGSVKGPVVGAMDDLPQHVWAVGGHPMCGKAVSGLKHADAALYRGARFVLCRSERTTPAAWKLARGLVEAVGARPIGMDAVHHDQVAATISGLPYALSAALALVAGRQAEADPAVWRLAASGFRDTSRLAGSDPVMMTDILLTNADAVLEAIRQAQEHLEALAGAIGNGTLEALHAQLVEAQQRRHEWESETTGQ